MLTLSHKMFRALLKKIRRKRCRQKTAQLRDEEEKQRLEALQSLPSYQKKQLQEAAEEELRREAEERERERLHNEWLERERLAQEEFRRKRDQEDEIRRQKEEKARKLQEEWLELQKKEKEKEEMREAALADKKRREEGLLKEATKNLSKDSAEGPWRNPPPPQTYGTENDKQNCPFFLKTGACRFGDRCSRIHSKPGSSCTILIPGMFTHFSIDQVHRDEYDTDMSLEYEETECQQHFEEFYEDVLPEFKKIGHVFQFKVCRNHEPHLRGNVYVQFDTEESAIEALQKFNGRFYAGRQLSCEFTQVTKWRSAICGLDRHGKCPKGRNCNFLHIFQYPSNEFFNADKDYSPSRDKLNSSRRSFRDSEHHSSRRASSTSSKSTTTSSRSRRSRSPSRRSRQRSRSKSRESSRRNRSSKRSRRDRSSSSSSSDFSPEYKKTRRKKSSESNGSESTSSRSNQRHSKKRKRKHRRRNSRSGSE